MAGEITAEAIQLMIQNALAAQAIIHRDELASQAARFQQASSAVPSPPASPTNSSTRSTVPRTRLSMGSPSLTFNNLGGTSTSVLSQAAVGRASASSSSIPSPEDLYRLLALDQSKNEKSLTERKEDPVTESGLVSSLQFFDEYNHLGGRRSLREFLGHTWLRTLERVQGVPVPDESDGDSALRVFLASVFHSPDSFNIRVETDFLAIKLELVKGRLSLDAMQSYAARFAKTLDDWTPSFPDPDDRPLNKRLVNYFYTGIEPEPLRSLVKRFPVDHVSDVFYQFRIQCTASIVEMVNLKSEKSLRDRQFRSRQAQQIPEPSRTLGGERRARKADSAGAKPKALFEEVLPIFDCDNCGGTHKSMNCKSDCRLCKSKGLDSNHIQFHCPKISNAAEKKKNQLPRKTTDSAQRSVKSATSGSRKTTGSIISAITQDDEYHTEEDSEVSDYPVYIDTCASDTYTPIFTFHSSI